MTESINIISDKTSSEKKKSKKRIRKKNAIRWRVKLKVKLTPWTLEKKWSKILCTDQGKIIMDILLTSPTASVKWLSFLMLLHMKYLRFYFQKRQETAHAHKNEKKCKYEERKTFRKKTTDGEQRIGRKRKVKQRN